MDEQLRYKNLAVFNPIKESVKISSALNGSIITELDYVYQEPVSMSNTVDQIVSDDFEDVGTYSSNLSSNLVGIVYESETPNYADVDVIPDFNDQNIFNFIEGLKPDVDYRPYTSESKNTFKFRTIVWTSRDEAKAYFNRKGYKVMPLGRSFTREEIINTSLLFSDYYHLFIQ